jgi:hypothetical protein
MNHQEFTIHEHALCHVSGFAEFAANFFLLRHGCGVAGGYIVLVATLAVAFGFDGCIVRSLISGHYKFIIGYMWM